MMSLDEIWQEYGLDNLKEGMRTLFPKSGISFDELLMQVMSGDVIGALSNFIKGNIAGMADSFLSMKNILVWLLVLGVVSALLTHFVEVFDKHQVADLSFYFVYLLLSAVLLKCFVQIAQSAYSLMENIVLFVKLLVPTYLLAVGVATGAATVNSYHHILLMLIYGVESILTGVILPLIYSHVILSVVNGIFSEEKLSLFVELLKKTIGWILKAILGAVTGLSLFQAVISPAVDSMKSAALQKAVAVVPGVGNAAKGIVELAVGSAIIIKNSIGVVLLILLLGLCAVPLLKIFFTAFLIKCAAAFMGIISDKRITACTNHTGDAGLMLFQAAGTAMLMFLICISIAAV